MIKKKVNQVRKTTEIQSGRKARLLPELLKIRCHDTHEVNVVYFFFVFQMRINWNKLVSNVKN